MLRCCVWQSASIKVRVSDVGAVWVGMLKALWRLQVPLFEYKSPLVGVPEWSPV